MNGELDAATALSQLAEGYWRGSTRPGYRNMNGPHGGTTAATALRAVLFDPRRTGSPLCLSVNFCAPIADGAFEVRTVLHRTGKTTQHWAIEFTQDAATVVLATCVMANRRQSWSHAAARAPEAPPWHDVPEAVLPNSPPWLSKFSFRFVDGGLKIEPRTASELRSARSTVWVSEKPPRNIDYLTLTALSDVFFPRIFQVRGKMVPMGTVSLTIYFHRSEAELHSLRDAPLLGIADARVFNSNFNDQAFELWSSAGDLIANGVQTAWFKE